MTFQRKLTDDYLIVKIEILLLRVRETFLPNAIMLGSPSLLALEENPPQYAFKQVGKGRKTSVL